MSVYLDERDNPVRIGQKIGSGGEGTVFDVVGNNRLVAKIYKGRLSTEKQAKLQLMARNNTPSIFSIAAWPKSVLHKVVPGGGIEVVGFMMDRLIDFEPLHNIYGPLHRKKIKPAWDWTSLVHVAMNTAAAVEVIHNMGCVIGDVNHSLVYVGLDGRVKLIDCDSFQIPFSEKLYLCEVGTPEYTPPELQRAVTYHGLVRTKNQDNFGLAVLVFQLLMMGRHPYAGVYNGGDKELKTRIKEYLYAYGRENADVIRPAPDSVKLDILPVSTALLFEKAFSRKCAVSDCRPTASDWRNELRRLTENLQTCEWSGNHKYYRGLSVCPWCELERHHKFYAFNPIPVSRRVMPQIDLDAYLHDIESVTLPGIDLDEELACHSIVPTPVPNLILLRKGETMMMYAYGLLALMLFLAQPSWFWYLAVPVLALYLVLPANKAYRRELGRRKMQQGKAFSDMELARNKWNLVTDDSKFYKQTQELNGIIVGWKRIISDYDSKKQSLMKKSRSDQLNSYLSARLIDEANLPGIGSNRRDTLIAYGVETAADIMESRIAGISGFGPTLINTLLQWRLRLESSFREDSDKVMDDNELIRLNNDLRKSQKAVEQALKSGLNDLRAVRDRIVLQREALLPYLKDAAKRLAQSEVDVAVLQKY